MLAVLIACTPACFLMVVTVALFSLIHLDTLGLFVGIVLFIPPAIFVGNKWVNRIMDKHEEKYGDT